MSRDKDVQNPDDFGPSVRGKVIEHLGGSLVIRTSAGMEVVVTKGGPYSDAYIARAKMGDAIIVKGFTPGTLVSDPLQTGDEAEPRRREYRALTLHAA